MGDAIVNGWAWLLGRSLAASASSGNDDARHRPVKPPALLDAVAVDPLVAQLQRGDEGALLHIVREHGVALEAIAFVTTRDDDLARDIVQDVCFDLWQRRTTLAIRGPLLPYLHRAVHHRAVTVVRRERTQRRIEDTLRAKVSAFPRASENQGPAAVEAEALARIVRTALASLPPRCREIFLLHRQGGLAYPEIAALLGISLPTVYNQIHRALKHLAQTLRETL